MTAVESVAEPAVRRLLLIAGEQGRGEAWVTGQLTAGDLAATLWVADASPAGVEATPIARVGQCLGAESRLLVFNAHQGFHPDAFAAAVGTLRGGGDCVLLVPPLETWPAFADPDKARFACYPRGVNDIRGLFLERLVRLWRTHPAVRVIGPDSPPALRVADPAARAFCLTREQQRVVEAIERVAHGHARRPLVLTADRGRGKSTVLGVAAARLLAGGLARVTVVAPHRAAVGTLFRHALATAGRAGERVADTVIGAGQLCFRLPHECIAQGKEALGLVLVDEAAAIPVAVLSRLLERSNRLVFVSTVHGYEGSGRGFELRFRSLLQQAMPQWHGLQLSAPVRWPQNDPLESLLDAAFLLDAELAEIDRVGPLLIERVAATALADDEPLLRQTFGLLINAHYQTRPSDLRQLLDNPDVYLWLARAGGAVVGVLLASAEGGFDDAMAARVLSGQRRPRGHLLPQSLAVHAGLDQALQLRVSRVQRIAVHPQAQRNGIGRRLLQAVAAWAAEGRFDLLGCAYGVDLPLLAFWHSTGMVAVRMGVRVDPASAAHSLFMLRGLSAAGRELVSRGQRDFQTNLPWSLAASLSDLDSRLAAQLLIGRDCTDLVLSASDRLALARVAAGARQAATAEAPVWKALVMIAAAGRETADRLAPLLAWRLQGRPHAQVCDAYSIAGRKGLEARLQALLSDTADFGAVAG